MKHVSQNMRKFSKKMKNKRKNIFLYSTNFTNDFLYLYILLHDETDFIQNMKSRIYFNNNTFRYGIFYNLICIFEILVLKIQPYCRKFLFLAGKLNNLVKN